MRPLLLSAIALALAACDVPPADDGPPTFGDAYAVEAAPPPSVADGRLRVTVSYAGGCRDHAFDLEVRAQGEAAEVWLVHDARGDLCEALLTETLDVPLPRPAADAPALRLRTPEGAAVVLR